MQIQSWKQLNELRSELYQALESSANFIHCVLKVCIYLRKDWLDLLSWIFTDLEIDSEVVLKQFDATNATKQTNIVITFAFYLVFCNKAYIKVKE